MAVLQSVIIGLTLICFTASQNQPNTIPQQGFQQSQPGMTQQGFPQAQPGISQQGFPQAQPGIPQQVFSQGQPGIPQQGFPQGQPGSPQQGFSQPQQPATNPNQIPNAVPANPVSQDPQETCAAAGRIAVSTCFQNNGGFRMDIVIALLSNGTQGQMPPNANQIKESLCRAQPQIIACILNSIRSFNGTQQCQSLPAYITLQQETTGLLSGVQQLCGNSLLPQVTECMRRLNYDMMNCFGQVGLNPDMYSPSGSRMNGAIIGDNRELAAMYCKKRKELFACQDKVLEACPRARDLQALSGNDQISMQKGIDVLCKDVNVYVSGLVCFQTPSDEVDSCANKLVTDITQLTMTQIQQNLPTELFFREYCKVRINNLVCDSNAWGNTCETVAVGLKREFQCNLLPEMCKNDTAIMDEYSRACATSTFSRGLRDNENGNGAVAKYASVFSVLAAIIGGMLLF